MSARTTQTQSAGPASTQNGRQSPLRELRSWHSTMPRDRSREQRHPLDQLTRSHERLRERIAEVVALGHGTEFDQAALEDLAAWFERQGARHEADEDESLFPRLRAAAIDDGIRA